MARLTNRRSAPVEVTSGVAISRLPKFAPVATRKYARRPRTYWSAPEEQTLPESGRFPLAGKIVG